MMRRISLIALAAALVLGIVALAPTPRADAWGSVVTATYTCYYGSVTMTMTWYGNSPYAAGQYVEMSYTDNGWKPETTTSVGPFSPKVHTMSWDGLAPLTRHFLRFTQQYPDGSWDASRTFRFDTPYCGADGFTVTFLPVYPDFFGQYPDPDDEESQ
jgi:hypothetical protein